MTLLQIAGRAAILVGLVVVSFFVASPFWYINDSLFNYQRPSGFFGFSLTDAFLAWTLSLTFLNAIMFGAIGKKVDYVFIILVTILAFLEYWSADNVTPQMYLGLVGIALVGNAIGYALKLARLKWFTKNR
jgi:hypothetical protein